MPNTNPTLKKTRSPRITDDAVHRHAPSQASRTLGRAGRILATAIAAIHADELEDAWGLLLAARHHKPSQLEMTRILANLSLVAFKRGDYRSALSLAWKALTSDAGVLTSWLLAGESALRLKDVRRASLLIEWGERCGAWKEPFIEACLERDPDCSRLDIAIRAKRIGLSLRTAVAGLETLS